MNAFRIRHLSLRDLRKYRENLEHSRHRIVVEGMRGKSGLVVTLYKLLRTRGERVLGKITGLEPKIFYEDRVIDIIRGFNEKFFLDEENVGIIANFPADIYVVENQAITRLTMRHFHRIYRPDIILIPNVRYEHMEGLGETIEEIAEAFALGFRGVEHVVFAKSTEKYDEVVAKIFKEYASKYGVDLRIIEVPEEEKTIPIAERVYLADEALRLLGYEMTEEEKEEIKREIMESLKPVFSPLGIWWYDASKVNDPESADLVLKHILSNTDRPVYILAYFRRDRVDRTKAFVEFFAEIKDHDRIRKVYVAGYYYRAILKRLREKAEPIRNEQDVYRVISEVKRNDGLLFLAVNAVTSFIDMVKDILSSSNRMGTL